MLFVTIFYLAIPICIATKPISYLQPQVQVKQGRLQGEIVELVTGDGYYNSFKGIPYARPPVGGLRFMAPQPALIWQGVRNATEHGPVCPQEDIFTYEYIPGSEDCLFLNVYTPDLEPRRPLPVMVFIHGGGFQSGSGNDDDYGPDFLVAHGIVLVTFNYRLDALGFLCMDTKEIPGNAGLKDQVQALKWVQDNIAQFGGDPDNVTLFGQSAGGASTIFHVLSPLSKGLFKRAISMSGIPNCDWAIPFAPARRAFVLGKQLGYDTKDPDKLLKFFQSLPVKKLIHTTPNVLSFEDTNYNILKMNYFPPVVEKVFNQDSFITKDPNEIVESGMMNDVDIIIGYTSQESLICIDLFESTLLSQYSTYDELFVPRKILYKVRSSEILQLADQIKQHYFHNKSINLDAMKEFAQFASDTTFAYDITRFVQRFPPNTDNLYYYKFSCVSERNNYSGDKYGISGVAHTDDLVYLFNAKKTQLPVDKNSRSYKMIQQTCTLFTNYAKYGNPTPNLDLGLLWKPYNNDTEPYMDINETLTLRYHQDADVVAFWKQVYNSSGLDY